jgi:hypothetical protein
MVLVVDEAQAKACFGPFKIVLIMLQDRCTVCTEDTIGSEIILHTPMKLLGDMCHVESSFIPFGDTKNLDAR